MVEKCHFCTQRTRKGRQPACQEACPTGARVFGNLLDPNSEIRYILENKTVFRLKEELGTEPKFWYYTDDVSGTAMSTAPLRRRRRARDAARRPGVLALARSAGAR